MFRNYDYKKFGQIIEKVTLLEVYKEYKLVNKYDHIFDYYDLNIKFLSFMQHSCSFSPFLDLTESHIIALSFATSKSGNHNSYFSSNAALYEFSFNKKIEELNDKDIYGT